MYSIKNIHRLFILLIFLFGLSLSFIFRIYLARDEISPEQDAFEKVFYENKWGGGSGIGSWPENATPYLKVLQVYLNDPKYKSVVDLGCGDWKLMETLKFPDEKTYIGYDLVWPLIEQNSKKYAKKNIKFLLIHQLSDVQNVSADLLIIKDVLHHWPVDHINYFLSKILPNYRNALITNDFKPFALNEDISFAEFRPINLKTEPFIKVDGLTVLLDYPSHGITKRIYLYKNPKFTK